MEGSEEPRAPLDVQLAAVAHERRRRLLFLLQEETAGPDGSVDLDGGRALATSRLEAIDLRHSHLPKLETFGFVEWDRSGRRVSRGPRFDEIEPLLAALREVHDEP